MNFIKIRIGDDLGKIDEDFDKTVDEMFRVINPSFGIGQNTWRPNIDIYEDSADIIILADIAGVKKENLQIEIDSRTVKLYGIRGEGPLAGSARYRLAEIPCGYFERSLHLPAPVDKEKAIATYTDGLLQIRIAKMPVTKSYKVLIRNG